MTDEDEIDEWVRWSDQRAGELARELDLWKLGEAATGVVVRWASEEPREFSRLGITYGMFRIIIARRRRQGWPERSIKLDCLGRVHDHADERSRSDRPGGPGDRAEFVCLLTALYDLAARERTLEDEQPGTDGWCPDPEP